MGSVFNFAWKLNQTKVKRFVYSILLPKIVTSFKMYNKNMLFNFLRSRQFSAMQEMSFPALVIVPARYSGARSSAWLLSLLLR